MKNYLKYATSALLVVLIALIVMVPFVSALSIPPPDTSTDQSALFGQDHAYTITFRGNGEAVVNMRVAFTNTGDTDQSTLSFRIPRVVPKDLVVYQIIRAPQCVRYAAESAKRVPSACLEYDEPDYYNPYWYGDTLYQKAKVLYEGDTITISLPKRVVLNESGSIVLYFRSTGYTKKGIWGEYHYIFESLKTKDSIKNLQVGITTDSNLRLKGAGSEVQYRFDDGFHTAQEAVIANKANVNNEQFNRYYQQIGQGKIVETAHYLQPLESFTVEGAYADTLLKLYAKYILMGSALFILFVIGGFFALRQMAKHAMQKSTDVKRRNIMTSFIIVGTSFGSSLFIAGYTIFIFFIFKYISDLYSGSYYSYNAMPIAALFLAMLSFGIYLLLLFGPSFFIGIKRGLWWGFGSFVLTILWLMLFFFILFGSMLIINRQNYDQYPQPIRPVYSE